MKKILLIVFALMMITTSNIMADNNPVATKNNNETAQFSSIQGRIIDKSTGEPLAGVTIKIEGTNLEVYSDFEGNFSFQNITPGIFNLKVSLVSYKENILKDINLSANSPSVLEIAIDN
jgi:hypothetical protein